MNTFLIPILGGSIYSCSLRSKRWQIYVGSVALIWLLMLIIARECRHITPAIGIHKTFAIKIFTSFTRNIYSSTRKSIIIILKQYITPSGELILYDFGVAENWVNGQRSCTWFSPICRHIMMYNNILQCCQKLQK